MKFLPYLLVNVVLVAGGIVVYDQLRDHAPAPVYGDAGGLSAQDLARLDARYLDKGGNEPGLRATGVDERLLARIAALEAKVGAALPEGPAAADPEAGPSAPVRPLASPDPAVPVAEPTDAEVARFRRLMERAEEARREERERERLAGFLERLEVNLNADQQEKLLATTRTYRRKWGETMRTVFSTVRERGGDREGARDAARQAMDGLRQEFTVEIQEYLSVGDAQKITENINQLVRGGFMGRGGPRPGIDGR